MEVYMKWYFVHVQGISKAYHSECECDSASQQKAIASYSSFQHAILVLEGVSGSKHMRTLLTYAL